jgi:uncharacterized protein YhbP (UPF0306 family)
MTEILLKVMYITITLTFTLFGFVNNNLYTHTNNKTDHHDITEIMLKVALDIITLTITLTLFGFVIYYLYAHSMVICHMCKL